MLQPDFSKYPDGLVPAIVQDAVTREVLMLGYMNETALRATEAGPYVTFYSRSRQALWTKGDTSGNYLHRQSLLTDCDNDCILVLALPEGPVCHTGAATCFGRANTASSFLPVLEAVISDRIDNPEANSYVAGLYRKGINKIAQKVGEEAVELVIEAKDQDEELFKGEAADLLFHYLILLQAKGLRLQDVEQVLEARHRKPAGPQEVTG